jgi:hypothetical protein
MKVPTVKQVVRNNQARFLKYENGNLWYYVLYSEDDDYNKPRQFDFPIPVADAGDGAFLSSDKAITYMRWIRKHIDYLNEAQS